MTLFLLEKCFALWHSGAFPKEKSLATNLMMFRVVICQQTLTHNLVEWPNILLASSQNCFPWKKVVYTTIFSILTWKVHNLEHSIMFVLENDGEFANWAGHNEETVFALWPRDEIWKQLFTPLASTCAVAFFRWRLYRFELETTQYHQSVDALRDHPQSMEN